jgi:hypothetical protein
MTMLPRLVIVGTKLHFLTTQFRTSLEETNIRTSDCAAQIQAAFDYVVPELIERSSCLCLGANHRRESDPGVND